MASEIIKFDIEIEQKRLAQSSREVLQKFKALDRAFDKLSPKGMTKVDASMKKASRTAARLNAEVRGASGQMNNLGRQAQITAKRFLVYNVIARFFFALANAIQEGTAAFISFDQELNKARQILNPLITDFDQFTKSIFELADAFGVTVKEVQAAQEVFIRQGKTQAQVTELTSQSLALAAAAGLDFAMATEAITASLNQFTGQGLLAVDIADKFTAVSIRNAVTADDLAQAIFRAGSAAATVGVEFDNLIGFITAAQEATRRGGRVIGTGLRTIFTRIFRAPSIAAMQELGIETRKTTGEFKNADHLISALAERFTTLSQTQQIAIASTIAGQRQVATLLALLRNFKKAQDAANDSVLAQGEAARLVRIRQEALSFQIQKITNQFVKFGVALGEVFSGPIIDEVAGIADTFAVFASVIESTGPALGILASSLSTVSLLLVAQLLGLGKVGGAYQNYKKSVQSTREEIAAFRKEASAKELSAAGQSGGFLQRKANRFLGPTKQLEATASEFKLKKQVAAMDKLISKEKGLQVTLQRKANVAQTESLALTEREGAVERANTNISNTGKTISETRLKLEQAILNTKEAISTIKPSQDSLNNLKAENKLIKANIKDRQVELANIVGSRGAGGKRGAQNLAKTGLSLERDRVKIATEVLRLEDKIGILKGKHGLKGVLTEQQRARVLQQLDKHTGARNRQRAALREDAARKEVKASRDVARANLDASKNLQKQAALGNRIAQQQRGVTAAKQQEVSLSEQIANLNEFIANTEGTIAILNFEIEASKIRQAGAGKGLSNIEKKQLGLLEAKLELEKAIKLQKERTASASKREQGGLLSRSGRGIGGGIAASIGFNLAAEGIRKLKKEGDKTTEGIAQGFETAGGIAVTAMLLPLGPLSLAIIALQVIIGAVKIASGFTTTWAKESGKINEQMDKLTNTLRLTKGVFKELRSIAGEIQLHGLSILNLSLINEKVEQLRKNFKDIDSEQFERLMGDARKAVRTNNADGLERINKQLNELAGQQILSDNIIPKDLLKKQKDAADGALRLRQIVEDPIKRKEFNKDHQNDSFVPGFGENALTRLGKANEKLKEIREDGKEATDNLRAGFIKASKATESYSQAVDRLKQKENFDITGISATANEDFLRVRKGFDIVADGNVALKEAGRENAQLFQDLLGVMDQGLPTLQATRNALDSLAETSGKNATLFFNVKDAINPLAKEFKNLAAQLALDTQGSVGAEAIIKTMDVLRQSLVDGKTPIRGFIDDTGEMAFKIQGLPGVIGKASKSYGAITAFIDKYGIVVGIAENATDTFGDVQLSNARVTELLAQKYLSLASSIKATTAVLASTKNAMNEIASLNGKLAASFPEKALDVNLKQMTALKDRAAGLGAGLEISINALSSLDEAMNIVRGTLGTRITDAFQEGGNASIDWANRLEVANEVVDDMGGRLERLSGQVKGADFGGGGQFTEFKAEIFNLTKELIAIEKLSGAVLGLGALREKLLKIDGGLLEDDTALLRKFEAILAQGFKFSGIDISGTNKEIEKEITRVLDSLSSTFRKKGAGIMGRAAQKLSVVIIEKMNTTLSTGGDTLSQRLDTILTQAANKIADKLQEPINDLRESLGALEQESIATLNSLVDNAESNLKTLADIIGKGIIPPEKTLTDILVGNFVVAEQASEVALGKIQKRLGQLKADNLRLVTLRDKAEKTNKDDLNRGEKIRRARDAVDASNAKVLEFTLKETAELKKQETLRSQQSQVLIQSIKQVGISFKNVISAQNAVATAEEKIFKSRLDFIDKEDATIGRRLAIIQLERQTFENIRRSVTGIEQSDVSAIGEQIVKLTRESIAASFTDTASSEFIKTRIAKLQEQFNVEKKIGEMRVKSLKSELDLLKKQEKQIKDLGLAFLKATTEQQKGMIGAARLTEKFFGGIGSGKSGPNTNQVKSSILNFLKNSDDKTRQSVIGQLERLKAAGGEIAPGVPAAKILTEMGQLIGNALFKNPAIAIAERQEKIQANILSEQKSLSEIARVTLRINAASSRSASQLSGEVAKRIVATQKGGGGDTLKNLQLSKQSIESAARQADKVIAKEQVRVDGLAEEATKMDSAAVSNKRFVDATSKVDTTIGAAGSTMEEFQTQAQDLRTALVEADDAFIEAQQGITDASNGVLVAFGNAAKAQADYTIGIAEATRENALAVGGFQTYREELSFVTTTYKEQINALQQVGATEQHIAALRVSLAKEQLSIFEAQISNVRSNARALLTQEGAGLDFFNAGAASAAAASIASELGITPGGTPTGAQQDELAKAILGLPLEMRQDLDKAFSSAPPGQRAGAFGLGELETLILSALGGRSDATPDLLSLEKQAAQQRFVIAENSTSQLESSRTATIAALDQLATAREALMEAQANKELARMQLDSLESELPQQTNLLGNILDKASTSSQAIQNLSPEFRAALESSTAKTIAAMEATSNRRVASAQDFRDLGFAGQTPVIGAGRGTLSGSEVAGLLHSASREKGAMPAGSNLGVFNTSETVLTRAQMSRLRGGKSTPNAAGGTGIIGGDNIVSLLQEIANRVAELRQGGITQKIDVTVENNRRVNIEGLAGLQTALQDIIGDRTGDLYTREEAEALEQVLQTILSRLRETGQISAIGT